MHWRSEEISSVPSSVPPLAFYRLPWNSDTTSFLIRDRVLHRCMVSKSVVAQSWVLVIARKVLLIRHMLRIGRTTNMFLVVWLKKRDERLESSKHHEEYIVDQASGVVVLILQPSYSGSWRLYLSSTLIRQACGRKKNGPLAAPPGSSVCICLGRGDSTSRSLLTLVLSWFWLFSLFLMAFVRVGGRCQIK